MTDQIPVRQELEELSEAYRLANEQEKEAKAIKDALKPAIMALISEVVREEVPLARKTVQLSNDDLNDLYGGDPEIWRQKEYPLWNIVAMEGSFDITTFTIEEDDGFVKFEFGVNGYKFGRTVASSAPSLDIEGLLNDDLADELLDNDVLVPKEIFEFNEKEASSYMARHPNSKKVFEKYTVKGKPSVRLLPFTAMEED